MGDVLGCELAHEELIAVRKQDGRQLSILNYGPEAFELSIPMAGHLLLQAAANGNEEGVRQAILMAAPVDCRRPFSVVPVLRNNSDMPTTLTHSIEDEGMTPLMHAALSGNSSCVALLLMAMADANSVEEDGLTPLHFAAKAVAIDSCNFLLKARANCDAKDFEGRTALMYVQSELSVGSKERDIWTATLDSRRRASEYTRPTVSPPLRPVDTGAENSAPENDNIAQETPSASIKKSEAFSAGRDGYRPKKIAAPGQIEVHAGPGGSFTRSTFV